MDIYCYIDDILITSHSIGEHEEHLRALLQVLQTHGLSINLTKCQFAQSQVHFLSYTINVFGIKPPTDRIDAILNYARPETISQLGRFLVAINYYRRCLARSSHKQTKHSRRSPLVFSRTKIKEEASNNQSVGSKQFMDLH